MSTIRSGRSERERHYLLNDQNDTSSNFIVVKYGDNQQAVFNAWCTAQSLLSCIRKTCSCDKDATIDLCDMEGNIRQLSTHPYEYANTFIDGRRTYILVSVEKQNDNQPDKYNFLLEDFENSHPELSDKMKQIQETHQQQAQKKSVAKMNWSTMRNAARVTTRSVKSREGRRASRDFSKF